ncbi:helix-turn-helix domain-containing protein [Saccharothrix sp. Mg75]|uniref:helix-turn-helix domain-containing protein n=1 Tax=Saccharothrix sp. Mg75 TaxID=3445357 RepID=UPI003EED3094
MGVDLLSIGENIVRFRRKAGMTQQQLSDRSGISLNLVRSLEQNSRTSARVSSLFALATALHVPLAALLDPAHTPGVLLRRARMRRGMSQEMLAARAGFNVAYISRIETGQRSLDRLPTLMALATALNVPPIELVPWLAESVPAQTCRCRPDPPTD